MPDPTSTNPLDVLAAEYVSRLRRGESPTIEEYADRSPELAEEIRDLFPAFGMVEQLKPDTQDIADLDRENLYVAPRSFPDIPNYRIFREIGRGGMGVVYEAEQVSLGRRVALKVLPATQGSEATAVDRFRREARAAAGLHHPNIVPVFEVGNTEEHNYYAMQFIVGDGLDQVISVLRDLKSTPGATRANETATQVALNLTADWNPDRPPNDARSQSTQSPPEEQDTVKLGASTTSNISGLVERNNYFRNVARIGIEVSTALKHAHDNGIIHRDIKPSNILLDTEGKSWVADFGLAKTDDVELTRTGNILGTLRYMSPERFSGPCDEQGDVYGIGATLYEMLSLQPLFPSVDQLSLVDSIKSERPRSLRLIDRNIPRDLETIVFKSVDKSRARRYRSPERLADDLQRFLDGRPILARRVGLLERMGLWVRKNPVVAALLTLVFVGLLIATIVSNRERRRFQILASQERAARTTAEGIRQFILDSFASVEPDKDGRDIKVYEVLKREIHNVEEEFRDDPFTQAELLRVFGEALEDLGENKDAEFALEKAAAILDDDKWRSTEEAVWVLGSLLKVYLNTGQNEKLLPLVEETRRRTEQYHSDNAPLMLSAEVSHGSVLYQLGRDAEAIAILEPAAAKSRELLGDESEDTLAVLSTLLDAYKWNSRDDEALSLAREIYQVVSRKYGPNSFQTAKAGVRLLESLTEEDNRKERPNSRRTEEHKDLEEKVLRIYQRELGNSHPDFLSLQMRIGFKYLERGETERAFTIIRQVYEDQSRVLGPHHSSTLHSLGEIARAYMIIGQDESAIPYLEEACQLSVEHSPEDHPLTLRLQTGLANLYLRLGRQDEALAMYEETYTRAVAAHGPQHQETLQPVQQLGATCLQLGRFKDGTVWMSNLVENLGNAAGQDHPQVINMMIGLVRCQLGDEQFVAAEQTARDMLSRIKKSGVQDNETSAFAYVSIAEAYLALERFEEARIAADDALALVEDDHDPTFAQSRFFKILADMAVGDVADRSKLAAAFVPLRDHFEELHSTRKWLVAQSCRRAAQVFEKLHDVDSREFWSGEADKYFAMTIEANVGGNIDQ